jgi:DNA-binding IclR family transcriptional regulator
MGPRDRSVLSEELERFIRRHVRSLSALELFLLIHRTAGRSWTAGELNRELRSNLQLVVDVLNELERAVLLRRDADDHYRWEPATPELQRLGDQLAEAHATYPFSVVKAIYAPQVDQIQALADAFKIKRD